MKKASPTVWNKSTATSEVRYAGIVRTLLKHRGVTRSKKRRGFGSMALWTEQKMFALLSSKGKFIVKLPRERVGALVASGNGERCDTARGRPMKECIALNETSKLKWLDLARIDGFRISKKEAKERQFEVTIGT